MSTTITVARDVGPDDLDALPTPYPTTTVKGKGNLLADSSTLMLFDQGQALGGLSYQVTSLVNSPSAEALDIAPPPPAVIKAHYLNVPTSYDSLRALAESIVAKAGAKTPFDKAVALQDWLANGNFKYTLKAPTVLNASDLTRFLNVTKSGYCQQFSFAMAVLARLLDIPSRVAYGFTSGSPVGDDEWQVTTHDAHAWPELYFSGFGWLRFEPTPSGSAGQGTAYAPTYTTESGGPSTGASSQSAPTAAPSSAAGNSSEPGAPATPSQRAAGRRGRPEPERDREHGCGHEGPRYEPVEGLRPGGGRTADPRPGGAVGGAAGDQAAALAPPQASRPAGPGGRRVGARGLARAQGRPG